jgi:hypothetical protein
MVAPWRNTSLPAGIGPLPPHASDTS